MTRRLWRYRTGGKARQSVKPTSPRIEALEERTLYSADFLTLLAADPESHQPQDDLNYLPATPFAADAPVEMVYIDSRVPDSNRILEDLVTQQQQGRNLQVVIINTTENGVETISKTIDQQAVDAIHIISHGSTSGFLLGNQWVDATTIENQADSLRALRESLTENADLLLYGCNLSASDAGISFAQQLAQITGADVASSNNATGHSTLNADWELETTTGHIHTNSIASNDLIAGWEHRLLDGNDEPNILDAAYATDFTINGNAGNDILVGAKNKFLVPTPVNEINLGTFKYSDTNTYTTLGTELDRGEGYSIRGLKVTNGTVDFIADNSGNGLVIPDNYDARAAVLDQNASVDLLIPNTLPNTNHNFAMYIDGFTAG